MESIKLERSKLFKHETGVFKSVQQRRRFWRLRPHTRCSNFKFVDPVAEERQLILTITEGLMRRLIQDAGSEPGSLPLLAFALEKLFNERSGNLLSEDVYSQLTRQQDKTTRQGGHPLAGRSRSTDVSCEKNFILSPFSRSRTVGDLSVTRLSVLFMRCRTLVRTMQAFATRLSQQGSISHSESLISISAPRARATFESRE
ncbi:MAG: hypothetical protein Q7J56_00250 [Deltaproteobacteria bacterium]|nr:hypothetical protein [Deltaproteobacteria bacterium]